MKVKWGMMMTDGRGKLGGQVASKNKAGAYVRTKVTPVNPDTMYQQSVRASFSAVTRSWRTLFPQQREAWNAAVNDWQETDVFGDLKTPSGFQLFMRLCTPLQNAFNSMIISSYPPPHIELPSLADVSLTVDNVAGTMVLAQSITNSVVADNFVYNVYATAPQSAGKSYMKNQLRLLGWVEANVASQDIASLYTDKFGSLPNDSNIQVQLVVLSRGSGELSPPYSAVVNFL